MSKRKLKLTKEFLDSEKRRRLAEGTSTEQDLAEYKCVFRKCKFSSGNEGDMRSHLMRSHKYKRYVYTCKHCEEGKRVENDIKAHISRVHPGLSVEYFVEEDDNQIESLLIKCRRSTGSGENDGVANSVNSHIHQAGDVASGSSHMSNIEGRESDENDQMVTNATIRNETERKVGPASTSSGTSSSVPNVIPLEGNGCFIDREGYWRCRYCAFKTRGSNITWHIRKHHSQKQFECGDCGDRQHLRNDVARHIGKTHPGKDVKVIDLMGREAEPSTSGTGRRSPEGPAAGSIQAALSAADSAADINYSIDQQPSSSSVREKVQKRRSSAKIPPKYITDSHGFFRCTLCDFKTSGNILWHIRTRHGNKNLKCGWCEFRHNFMYFVELHSDKTHPGWEVVILDESTGRQCRPGKTSGSIDEKRGCTKRRLPPRNNIAQDRMELEGSGQYPGEVQSGQVVRVADEGVGNNDDSVLSPGLARSKKECYRDNGDWVCVHCGFRSKGHLRWHILKEHRGKTHRCGYCNYQRYVKYEIIRHIKNRHPGGDIKNILYIVGGETDESLVSSSVLGSPQHSTPQKVDKKPSQAPVKTKRVMCRIDSSKIVRNKDGLLVCPSCPYRNKHTTNMRDHLATKHGIYRAQCGHCEFKAAYVARINIHCKRQHPTLPCRVIELDEGTGSPASHVSTNTAVSSSIKKKAMTYAANKLGGRFKPTASIVPSKPGKKAIQSQSVSGTPHTSSIVGSFEDDLSPGHTKAVAEYFTISTTASNEEQFHCRMCPFKTKVRQTIYTHRYIHEPEAFQCPYCGVKRKPPRSTMTLHLRRRHPNKPPHVIDLRQTARRIGKKPDRTSSSEPAEPEVHEGDINKALKYEPDDIDGDENNAGIDLTLNGESGDEMYGEDEGVSSISSSQQNFNTNAVKQKSKGKVLLGKIKIMKPKSTTATPSASNKPKTPKGSKTVYRCSFDGCVFEGRDRPTMRVHLFTHLNYSPYQCYYCKIHKRQVAHIKFHLAREHPGIESKHIYDNNERIESELERLLDECTTVLDGDTVVDTPALSRLQLARKVEVYEECPHCTYRTKSKDLYKHIESAHKEKKYRCEVCSYEALFPSYVRRHCKPRHPDMECIVVRIADGKVIPPLDENNAQKDTQNAELRTESPKNLKVQLSEVAKLVKKAAGNITGKENLNLEGIKVELDDPLEEEPTTFGDIDQPMSKQSDDCTEDEVEKFKNMLYKNIIRSGMDFREETPADGNCFFHAVSDQMKRLNLSQKTASELREMLMDFMRNLPKDQQEFYQDFVEDEEFEEYIESISRDGMYADHLAVEMMAKMLNRKFHIVTSSPDGQQSDIIETLINEEAAEQGPPVLLGHYYEYHYQSLDVAKAEAESLQPQTEILPPETTSEENISTDSNTIFQCMYCEFSGKLRRAVIDHSLKAHSGFPDVEPLIVEIDHAHGDSTNPELTIAPE